MKEKIEEVNIQRGFNLLERSLLVFPFNSNVFKKDLDDYRGRKIVEVWNKSSNLFEISLNKVSF